jgi:Ca2+/Na+ antiporter
MVSINFFIIIVAGLILVAFIAKLLKNSSTTPDPWENEISKDEVNELKREICLNCGAEVNDGQYYCPKCNNATGKYVPYLPFVNIPFNYSMHQNLWSKLKSKDVSLIYKMIAILFIVFTAPIMIIVYLVLALLKGIKAIYRWLKKL